MKRVAVLASGRGSNLAALLAAESSFASYRIERVVSNVAGAGALDIARAAGRQAIEIPSRGATREGHEGLVLAAVSPGIEVLCLAGYMRLLSPAFFSGFERPILNVHPSLLPAFPGLRPQKQAIDAGVRWSGATVHLVDEGLDSGPILLQEPVPVNDGDTEESLSRRILEAEHRIYPPALDIVATRSYRVVGRSVVLLDRATT